MAEILYSTLAIFEIVHNRTTITIFTILSLLLIAPVAYSQSVAINIKSTKRHPTSPGSYLTLLTINNNSSDTLYFKKGFFEDNGSGWMLGNPIGSSLYLTGVEAEFKVPDFIVGQGMIITRTPGRENYYEHTNKFFAKHPIPTVGKPRLADMIRDSFFHRILPGQSVDVPTVVGVSDRRNFEPGSVRLTGADVSARMVIEFRYFRNSSVIMNVDTIYTPPSEPLKKAALQRLRLKYNNKK